MKIVSIHTLKHIQRVVDEALDRVAAADYPNKPLGAINFANLRCVEAIHCKNQDGEHSIRITVEKAAPYVVELHMYIADALKAAGYYDISISTEW